MAAPQDEGTPSEVVAVRQAFAAAPSVLRSAVNETLNLVKMGADNPRAYVEALPQLQHLADNPDVSAEQKQTLEVLIREIKSGSIGRVQQ